VARTLEEAEAVEERIKQAEARRVAIEAQASQAQEQAAAAREQLGRVEVAQAQAITEAGTRKAEQEVRPSAEKAAETQSVGTWSRAKADLAGGTRSPSPQENKCPDPTCAWPNSAEATVCARCRKPLTLAQEADPAGGRALAEGQAQGSETQAQQAHQVVEEPPVDHFSLIQEFAGLGALGELEGEEHE
jgi:hypothetical protein